MVQARDEYARHPSRWASPTATSNRCCPCTTAIAAAAPWVTRIATASRTASTV